MVKKLSTSYQQSYQQVINNFENLHYCDWERILETQRGTYQQKWPHLLLLIYIYISYSNNNLGPRTLRQTKKTKKRQKGLTLHFFCFSFKLKEFK